jgi:hypothetical protein
MDYTGQAAVWQADEQVLAEIGGLLFLQVTEVEVRLPRLLADQAVAAWQREDEVDGPFPDESCEERIVRHRAGALALIGAALEDGGRAEEDEVVVRLDAWFIGDALNAAGDQGLIHP